MNFALLFAIESDCNRFKKKHGLDDFIPLFIPVLIPDDSLSERERKNIYNNYIPISGRRKAADDYLPDFLK
jgi:hypothetical protein